MNQEVGGFRHILAFVDRQPEQGVCTGRKLIVLFTLCSLPHDALPYSKQLIFTADGHDRIFFKKKKMALGMK